MRLEPYPKWKRGLKAGGIAGVIAGVLGFVACLWAAALPAISVVSLSWSFRPWWRLSNWTASLAIALAFFVIVGLLTALTPERDEGPASRGKM